MSTCKSCRWWGQYRDPTPAGLNVCDGHSSTKTPPAQQFTVDLPSGVELSYGCEWPELYTGPDFGCVNHTPKEG